MTIAAVGAAGGFGASAGTFTFTETSAFVSTFDPISGASINVNVDRTTFVSRQRPGGALQTGVMTVLSVNQFIPNPDPTQKGGTSNSTCLVIPDADFTVSSDLTSATLNTVDQSTLCPFFLAPINGAVIQGPAPGGGGSIALPVAAKVTWTGNGVLTTSDDTGTTRCLTFVSVVRSHNLQGLSSSVSGTVTAAGESFASFAGGQSSGVFGSASVNTSIQTVAGRGILPPPCGGKGG